jgi:hypothetical protein
VCVCVCVCAEHRGHVHLQGKKGRIFIQLPEKAHAYISGGHISGGHISGHKKLKQAS